MHLKWRNFLISPLAAYSSHSAYPSWLWSWFKGWTGFNDCLPARVMVQTPPADDLFWTRVLPGGCDDVPSHLVVTKVSALLEGLCIYIMSMYGSTSFVPEMFYTRTNTVDSSFPWSLGKVTGVQSSRNNRWKCTKMPFGSCCSSFPVAWTASLLLVLQANVDLVERFPPISRVIVFNISVQGRVLGLYVHSCSFSLAFFRCHCYTVAAWLFNSTLALQARVHNASSCPVCSWVKKVRSQALFIIVYGINLDYVQACCLHCW